MLFIVVWASNLIGVKVLVPVKFIQIFSDGCFKSPLSILVWRKIIFETYFLLIISSHWSNHRFNHNVYSDVARMILRFIITLCFHVLLRLLTLHHIVKLIISCLNDLSLSLYSKDFFLLVFQFCFRWELSQFGRNIIYI